MNILVLAPFFPYPLDQGGKIRIFNIVKQLSRSHRVTLACLSPTDVTDFGPLRDWCEEIVVVARPPRPALDLTRFLFGREAYNCLRFSSAQFRRALLELCSRRAFDLVQVELTLLWQYADLFPEVPVVLNTQNIEHRIIRELGAASVNPFRKVLYRLEGQRLRRAEERAWREAALCFAVSDRERDEIAACTGVSAKVITIPNGVDLERFLFRTKEQPGKNILLLGGMDYTPNLDAARWFLDEIFPLIRRQEPEARLLMVGRELWRLKSRDPGSGIRESVEFHEDVPEVLPWFYAADLLVVPLRMGAGTRIKVLEAMAAGLPVVTTSKGCEGIAARDGEHLLVADSPDEFTAAVRCIMQSPACGKRLAINARNLVTARYTWEAVAMTMAEAYRQMVGG